MLQNILHVNIFIWHFDIFDRNITCSQGAEVCHHRIVLMLIDTEKLTVKFQSISEICNEKILRFCVFILRNR